MLTYSMILGLLQICLVHTDLLVGGIRLIDVDLSL